MDCIKRIRIHFYKRICIPFLNKFLSGKNCFKYKNHILRCAGYKIGDGTKVVGPVFITADLSIGKNCWIGAFFKATGNGKVTIGNCVDIAPEVTISTGGHQIGDFKRRAGKGVIFNTIIEDGCWICQRAIIANGAIVKKGSVVASGAVVVKTFDDNCLLAGVPAIVKKKYNKN